MTQKAIPRWDQHVLLVFSVLACIAWGKLFDLYAHSLSDPISLLFAITIFYIILDNWYWLHKDLMTFDVEISSEVIFYLLAAISYACLPYIYGVSSQSTDPMLSAPEWLIINLFLICVFDSIRKCITLRKIRSKPRDYFGEHAFDTKQYLAGAYVFYTLTGVLYSLGFIILFLVCRSSNWSITIKSLLVICIWAFVRISDTILIPKFSKYMYSIYFGNGPTT